MPEMCNWYKHLYQLVIYSFSFFAVLGASNYGIDPATEIDLTKALSLDIDNLEGVSQVPGFHNNAPAFMFDGI